MTKEFTSLLSFARQHRNDDPLKLLLQQSRYPDVDLRLAAQQIEGQRQAATKWPTLALCDTYLYPPRINREQSSSEATARYKTQIFASLGGGSLADLTGGMGVDTYFMAQQATHADYHEIDPGLCTFAQHNFAALRQDNIQCHCGDSLLSSQPPPQADLLYIDPARRDSHGRKVAAFDECTPNLLDNLERLRSHCRHLLVKASPMIDLRLATLQLAPVAAIHIVAFRNECKEVLFLLPGKDAPAHPAEPTLHCVDLADHNARILSLLTFTHSDEASAVARYATQVGQYLYEPNAALMKGACFNLLCQQYGVEKLAHNTHLYTSQELTAAFPGRTFRVLHPLPLKPKEARKALPDGKAHVLTRNYPLPAAQLQQRLKLEEGGDLFVIAATLGTRHEGWLCQAVTTHTSPPHPPTG